MHNVGKGVESLYIVECTEKPEKALSMLSEFNVCFSTF